MALRVKKSLYMMWRRGSWLGVFQVRIGIAITIAIFVKANCSYFPSASIYSMLTVSEGVLASGDENGEIKVLWFTLANIRVILLSKTRPTGFTSCSCSHIFIATDLGH